MDTQQWRRIVVEFSDFYNYDSWKDYIWLVVMAVCVLIAIKCGNRKPKSVVIRNNVEHRLGPTTHGHAPKLLTNERSDFEWFKP